MLPRTHGAELSPFFSEALAAFRGKDTAGVSRRNDDLQLNIGTSDSNTSNTTIPHWIGCRAGFIDGARKHFTHMDEFEAKVLDQFRQIIDQVRNKKIIRQEAIARLYELAGTIEGDQWRVIDDLRTRALKNESELARAVAELLEAELRKGSGNA
jgi:hypothetical protein